MLQLSWDSCTSLYEQIQKLPLTSPVDIPWIMQDNALVCVCVFEGANELPAVSKVLSTSLPCNFLLNLVLKLMLFWYIQCYLLWMTTYKKKKNQFCHTCLYIWELYIGFHFLHSLSWVIFFVLEPASPKTQGSILQKPKSNYGDRTGKAQHDQFPLCSFFMRHSAMLVPSGRFQVPLGATGREKQNQTHHRFNPTQSSGGNPLKLISKVEKHNSVT